MYYEINVSLNGSHYFATAERSLRDEREARIVLSDIRSRFTEEQGFKASITLYQTTGKRLDW